MKKNIYKGLIIKQYNNQYLLFASFFLFFFIFFIIFNHNSSAQTINDIGSPFIRNYTPKEYNGKSQNWAIVQDKRGIMYFGNNDGILEYDSKNWKLIKVSNNSHVRSLAIDSNNTIYVGASDEFGYLASDETGKLKYISLKNKLKEKDEKFNDVWEVFVTTDGVCFVTKDKIFRLFNNEINVIQVNFPPIFSYIAYNELFTVNEDSGIYVLKNNKLQLLPYSDKIISGNSTYVILPYSEKKILIGASNKGFFTYDLNMLDNKDFPLSILSQGKKTEHKNISSSIIKKIQTEIDEYINVNSFYSCVKTNNNHYVFGTVGGGIIIMDQNGKLVQIINKNRGLQNNIVLKLFVDKSQNLWAALGIGISTIEISSPITKFDELNGLEDVTLSTIEHNNKRYIGNIFGAFYLPKYKIDVNNDKHIFQHVENYQQPCLNFYSDKNLLLAFGLGVILINDTVAEDIFNVGQIYCFAKSKKFPNHIFLGLTDGFATFEIVHNCKNKQNYKSEQKEIVIKNNTKFINHGRFNNINEPIRKIVGDNNGDLWLTTEFNGIIHLKFTGNSISDYQLIKYDTTNGLPQLNNNNVHYINNNLIVATKNGIYKAIIPAEIPLDNSKSISNDSLIKFVQDTSYGKMFSIDSIEVTQIKFEGKNKIWLNTNIGIGTLIKNQNNIYNWYDVPFKKLPPHKSIIKFNIDKNGIIWICTNEGLFRYDPSINKDYNIPFHSIIRKVTINNDSVIFNGTYYDNLSKKGNYFTTTSLTQPQQLIPELPYKQNSIIFEYSTIYYEKGESNLFRYFLEGFDKQWSNWTDETKKEYTNLPEGTYHFKVKAKNIYKNESSEAIYEFTILSPWYRTILAYVIYVLVFIFIFYIGLKLYYRHLIAANLKLERIISDRTEEIEKQNEDILLINAEISNKNEEIQTQAKHLKDINKELEKLSIVASETDNAIMIMDAKGNFKWINNSLTQTYGYTLEQIIKERGENIINSSSNPDIKIIIDNCIKNKKSEIYESFVITKSGIKKWAQTTLTPIIDDNGNVSKLIAIDSDISKIKIAEKEIENQSKLLENKNILITKSISYAQLIQQAILPSEKTIKSYLPDSFIYFKPKDIISGDFYWFSKHNEKLFIAVVDCTGHGVPGALMSMIGNTLLNEIINVKKIFVLSEILEKLNYGVISALKQDDDANYIQNDGMDISICCIDKEKNELQIASANQIAYLVNNKQIKLIESDIYSIGETFPNKTKISFTNHIIKIEKGTTIYLFTDGYRDQYGGKQDTKFMEYRFRELIFENSHHNMNEQLKILDNTFEMWKGKNSQIDDVLILGIRFNG